MDHDAVVEDWQQYAERHAEENYDFLLSMKFRDYGFDADELAGELHEQAFLIVDCTRCANCCKTMDIKFSNEDVERIAVHLDMATANSSRRTWKPTKRTARTRLDKSRARFSATMITVQSTTCGLQFVENIRTRIKWDSHSERWRLRAIRSYAPPCSGLWSR